MFSSFLNEILRASPIGDNNDELWCSSFCNKTEETVANCNLFFVNKCIFNITCTSKFCSTLQRMRISQFKQLISTTKHIEFSDSCDKQWSVTCDVCHNKRIYFIYYFRPYFTVITKRNLIVLMMMMENKIKLLVPLELVKPRNKLTQLHYSSILINQKWLHCPNVQTNHKNVQINAYLVSYFLSLLDHYQLNYLDGLLANTSLKFCYLNYKRLKDANFNENIDKCVRDHFNRLRHLEDTRFKEIDFKIVLLNQNSFHFNLFFIKQLNLLNVLILIKSVESDVSNLNLQLNLEDLKLNLNETFIRTSINNCSNNLSFFKFNIERFFTNLLYLNGKSIVELDSKKISSNSSKKDLTVISSRTSSKTLNSNNPTRSHSNENSKDQIERSLSNDLFLNFIILYKSISLLIQFCYFNFLLFYKFADHSLLIVKFQNEVLKYFKKANINRTNSTRPIHYDLTKKDKNIQNKFINSSISPLVKHLVFTSIGLAINQIDQFNLTAQQIICIIRQRIVQLKLSIFKIRPSSNSPNQLNCKQDLNRSSKVNLLNKKNKCSNQPKKLSYLQNNDLNQINQNSTLNYKDIKWSKYNKFSYWLSVSVILLSIICSVRGTANKRQAEKKILDSIIGQGKYDSRIRPSGVNNTLEKDGPCIVNVNIYVRSIGKISDLDMEYAIQITFREEWNDSRLEFNSVNNITYLTLTEPEKIWKPDLFFSNEKEGHFHNIIMPNVLLRIYPDGKVLYSIRISLVLSCPMNLKYYPLDKQQCQIKMGSYGYTTEDLIFYWKKENAVQVAKNLNLPTFSLYDKLTGYCTSKTNTGEYSCIVVDLIFKREFSYYLIQIYIPNSMLVIVSWVSFWLDPNAIPARVSLGVTTLLTMATQISGINASLPPVSYTKAIDVWTGVCLTFVFGALIEFALVNYASRKDTLKNKREAAKRNNMMNGQAANQMNNQFNPLFPNTGIGPLSNYGTSNAMGPLGMSGSNRMGNLMNQITNTNKVKHIIAPPKMDYSDQGFFFDNQQNSDRAMPVIMPMNQRNRSNDLRSCEVRINPTGGNFLNRWLASFPSRSKRIDVVSRICFPTMFGMFNVVYWMVYLLRDDLKEINKK